MERAVYRGQLTKLTNSASEYLNSSDSKSDKTEDIDLIEDELVSFIERINSVLGTLRKCNDEIRPSIKLENAQKEFETIYDGHFHEWLPFWERFRVAVHDRTDLTGTDKFNYLSNHLVGKAADTIAGFTPTNANYDSAVSLLLEQYGNVDKLVDHTMQQLMNLSRHDVTKLRKLYTDIRAHTRSLTALNVPSSQYSIMLRSLILHCLPHDLVIDVHRLHPSKQDKAARSIEDENASLSVEEVLLQTATIIASSNSSSVPVRIILDGGSQRAFVKENIVTKLQLDTHDTVKLRILPFGDSNNSEPKLFKRVRIKLRSLHSDEAIEILAIVVPEICSTAFQYVRSTELDILGLKLADTSYLNETEFEIGMLIGADIYWSIVKDDFKRITDNLVAIDTIFGWTLQGPISTQGTSVTSTNLNVGAIEDNSLESLVDRIERLWVVDDITSNHHKLQVDDIIEKHIRKNGTRYEASLLWRNDECTIDNNRGGALKGLRRSLVKLSEDPEKLRQYDEIIREMISSGVAEICDEAEKTNERTYFMRHRPVYREER
ncbi:unnamed protein product [Hermetia illucens]|uniref:Peptidase aspartic putative domain-containing protein n=1 Tax=Hermetia illucens TaxID=343691 RepID=A0A7R8UJP4_HERIL|nr:unnamed protein product [Hermetia illucens]